MLGCGLPVCAVGFAALPELITHGANGLVFGGAPELASQLASLLAPGAAPAAALDALRNAVAASEAGQPRWDANWRAVAAPLMRRAEAPPGAALRVLRSVLVLTCGYALRVAAIALYRAC